MLPCLFPVFVPRAFFGCAAFAVRFHCVCRDLAISEPEIIGDARVQSGHAQVRLMPIPSSKMHPRNRSPCQPIARPSFSRTRPPLSIRALHSARDHDFEVATHNNARDPILDPEIIAIATDISFGSLSILELPIAPGIV